MERYIKKYKYTQITEIFGHSGDFSRKQINLVNQCVEYIKTMSNNERHTFDNITPKQEEDSEVHTLAPLQFKVNSVAFGDPKEVRDETKIYEVVDEIIPRYYEFEDHVV